VRTTRKSKALCEGNVREAENFVECFRASKRPGRAGSKPRGNHVRQAEAAISAWVRLVLAGGVPIAVWRRTPGGSDRPMHGNPEPAWPPNVSANRRERLERCDFGEQFSETTYVAMDVDQRTAPTRRGAEISASRTKQNWGGGPPVTQWARTRLPDRSTTCAAVNWSRPGGGRSSALLYCTFHVLVGLAICLRMLGSAMS